MSHSATNSSILRTHVRSSKTLTDTDLWPENESRYIAPCKDTLHLPHEPVACNHTSARTNCTLVPTSDMDLARGLLA